jgi:hypothetical protein
MINREIKMINVGDKVKCINGYSTIPKGAILKVLGVQLSWDGQGFLHFKEVPYSYSAKDFEKC